MNNQSEKSERVDLGLALLSKLRAPGERLSCAEAAAWCDCSEIAIRNIEAKALAKAKGALEREGVEAEM